MVEQIDNSSKAVLARILATENIKVRITAQSTTASMDINRRVLWLPNWQDMSNALYNMLIIHEVGHAIETPNDQWTDYIRAHPEWKSVLNVVEDVRIDRLQKKRYPGSGSIYAQGYEELWNRDFFGLKASGRSINNLNLVDRINCYYKGGLKYNIKFTEAEMELVKEVYTLETFDEVLKFTEKLIKFVMKGRRRVNSVQNVLDDLTNVLTDTFNKATPEASEDEAEETDVVEVEAEAEDQPESESNSPKVDDFTFDDMEALRDDPFIVVEPDNDDNDDGESKGSNEAGNKDLFRDDDAVTAPVTIVSETNDLLDENLKGTVRSEVMEVVYLNKPPKEYTDKFIDDYTKVLADWRALWEAREKTWRTSVIRRLHSYRTDEASNISYLIKEFQVKKAADEYSKSVPRKSGKLDMNRLHSYRYSDEIFKTNVVQASGKNHGLVLLLDWSSSMHGMAPDAVKRILTISEFCRRTNIPFEVYIFRNWMESYVQNGPNGKTMTFDGDMPARDDLTTDHYDYGSVKLRNILSSRMTQADYNFASAFLYSMAFDITLIKTCDRMSGTPLNAALHMMPEIINDFQSRNNIQVTTFMCITDGEDNGFSSEYSKKRVVLQDYGREYPIDVPSYYNTGWEHRAATVNATSTYIHRIKDLTGANTIGYYIVGGYVYKRSRKNLAEGEATWFIKFIDGCKLLYPDKKSDTVSLSGVGYDEYILMSQSNLTDYQDWIAGLDIKRNEPMKKALKKFTKAADSTNGNREFLRRFVTRITT